MMLKSKPIQLSITPLVRLGVSGVAMFFVFTAGGCRQAGGQAGANGYAPISQLPGQPMPTGPSMPSLGPFGASARVPPPPTGSYGNSSGIGAGLNAMPANYAPSGLAPMSYNDAGQDNPIARAGGGELSNISGSPWHETSTVHAGAINPQMDLSRDSASGPRGGMPVNDLTGAASPPGYSAGLGFNNVAGGFLPQPYQPQPHYPAPQPGYTPPGNSPGQYPATTLMAAPNFRPMPNSGADNWSSLAVAPTGPPPNLPSTSQPIPRSETSNPSPAANQPAFSTADRLLQWQPSRR